MNKDSRPENMATQDILSLLQWYVDSGVDETIDDDPLDWFALSQQAAHKKSAQKPSSQVPQQAASPQPSPVVSVDQIAGEAEQLAAACDSLEALNEAIRGFNGSSLKNTATNTFFSDGNPDSHIMLIGDAPGVDEDRYGKAFVGRNGQLLERMFAAIDLSPENNFYITHILPWRPPGNRVPTADEITIFMPFLMRHIALFKPRLIILLGGISANSILNSDLGITRLRGKWMEYGTGDSKIPVRAIFQPAYLVKQPKAKGDVWRDLLEIRAKIGEWSQ